jgi:ribosomal protein S18
MNNFLAIQNAWSMMKEAAKNILESIAAEQIQLETYKQSEKANSLVIESRQNRINLQYDNIDLLQQFIEELPGIYDQYITEIKAKAEAKEAEKKCPVCFPPNPFYPFYSASEKEAARARSILEAKIKYNF